MRKRGRENGYVLKERSAPLDARNADGNAKQALHEVVSSHGGGQPNRASEAGADEERQRDHDPPARSEDPAERSRVTVDEKVLQQVLPCINESQSKAERRDEVPSANGGVARSPARARCESQERESNTDQNLGDHQIPVVGVCTPGVLLREIVLRC